MKPISVMKNRDQNHDLGFFYFKYKGAKYGFLDNENFKRYWFVCP